MFEHLNFVIKCSTLAAVYSYCNKHSCIKLLGGILMYTVHNKGAWRSYQILIQNYVMYGDQEMATLIIR